MELPYKVDRRINITRFYFHTQQGAEHFADTSEYQTRVTDEGPDWVVEEHFYNKKEVA